VSSAEGLDVGLRRSAKRVSDRFQGKKDAGSSGALPPFAAQEIRLFESRSRFQKPLGLSASPQGGARERGLVDCLAVGRTLGAVVAVAVAKAYGWRAAGFGSVLRD